MSLFFLEGGRVGGRGRGWGVNMEFINFKIFCEDISILELFFYVRLLFIFTLSLTSI